MNIVLGSSSPRRKTILSGLFETFEIISPSVDERIQEFETPLDFSMRVSREKCAAILNSYTPMPRSETLVITADTIVALEDAIIGKPKNFNDALGILSLLNGKTHGVITCLTLAVVGCGMEQGCPATGCEITKVRFKKLGREDIISYLDLIDYRDKAGGYAFQEYGDMIIENFHGSATNIIGFPLRLFFSMVGELELSDRLFA
jgi:septum formation protein